MITYDTPIYIAGPMSGHENFNYPAFHDMEEKLKSLGYKNILSPARIADGDTSKPYEFYMREALNMVLQAGALVFLDNWQTSRGATLEYQTASLLNIPRFTLSQWNFGIPMPREQYYLDPLQDEAQIVMGPSWAPVVQTLNVTYETEVKETICQEADRLVSEDRQKQYGHPKEDFERAAKIWGVILHKDDIRPEQVAMCMIGTKLSRLCHQIKRDSLVDIAGYAKTISLILPEA